MPIKELKCIEILIRFLVRKSSLKHEISSEFNDISVFEDTKTNLFNMISINSLIEEFDINQPFSLELFLNTGSIPGMYDEKTFTPSEDLRYHKDYKTFYIELITALKEGNYLFDESNNVFISSEKIETTIPQIWLYRLAQACQRNKYERMYFYNKNTENHITDKNALLDYLRHTKTFLVELSSSNPNADYNQVFADTESKTNEIVKLNREIKVRDIMDTFEQQLSKEYTSRISKYKLSDAFFIISKAERMGRTFYSETLEVQKEYLNKWMLEYINSNEKAKNETQKFVLIASTKNIHGYDIEELDKKSIIIGLFNLYLQILSSLDLDLEAVSLADFKIDEYISSETELDLIELDRIIKNLNKDAEAKSKLSQKLTDIGTEISSLDLKKDKEELDRKKEERNFILNLYTNHEKIEDDLNSKRNFLQEKVRVAKLSSIESIAFDNDLIVDLLIKCTKSGRVYFKPGSNHIVFELYNEELGKVIFKSSISLEKALLFIENNNFKLEDYAPTLR